MVGDLFLVGKTSVCMYLCIEIQTFILKQKLKILKLLAVCESLASFSPYFGNGFEWRSRLLFIKSCHLLQEKEKEVFLIPKHRSNISGDASSSHGADW